MYGRRPRCKRNLTYQRSVRVQPCIRPLLVNVQQQTPSNLEPDKWRLMVDLVRLTRARPSRTDAPTLTAQLLAARAGQKAKIPGAACYGMLGMSRRKPYLAASRGSTRARSAR
jgi:hypothetical protein